MYSWNNEFSPLRGGSSVASNDLGSANFFQGLANSFTGNLDFERSKALANQANEFSALEAQKARDWQTEMSNTAYQRAAADLKAAGLNPALVLSGASGASSGSGAVAHSSTARSSPTDAFGNLVRLVGTAVSVGSNIAINAQNTMVSNARELTRTLRGARGYIDFDGVVHRFGR